MKKLLFLGLVLGGVTLASCSKTYTCEYPGGTTAEWNSKDHNQATIDAAKTSCNLAGGTWSTN